MKLLLDADVLLDVALDREPFVDQSSAVGQWCQQMPGSAMVAWPTISNIYYMMHIVRGDATTREFIADLLHFADVSSGGTQAVRQALTMKMSDFEDALQVAAAMAGQANFIVTRNLADYRGSIVPLIKPQDFLSRFSTPR